MLHGRGATASDILTLAHDLGMPDVAYLAPQAAESTWYPNRFSAPVASNEPWLSSALGAVAGVLSRITMAGIPIEHTLLLGFSQGACLALEFAARTPQSYGGVVGLSGALIENGDGPRAYAGSLERVSVFLGCSTTDPHVPRERVEQSAEIFRGLGADVTLRLYPNIEHTIIPDEVQVIRHMIDAMNQT
jgi:predicted esterase